MWSIVEICYANAEYVREQAERSPESIEVLTKREQDLPSSEPLQTLVARLRRPSPVALDLLVQMFCPAEGYAEFIHLVREYLPDREEAILKQNDIADRMYTFAVDFSDRYFPLESDWLQADVETDYCKLTEHAPAQFQAFTSEDYDEIPISEDPTLIVIAYILENPWSTSDKAAFAEAAARYLPERLIRHIPEEGFPLKELEDSLKGTVFEPIAFWGKVISQDTDNYFFDVSHMEDTGAEFHVSWDRPTVEELTNQYQAWEEWQGKWSHFTEWFAKEIKKNTFDLIKILKERSKENGGDESDIDEDPWPIDDPCQGRLFDILADGTSVAGSRDPQDTTGPTQGPFGLL